MPDECPLGGDTSNNCEGCVYSTEYRYDTKTGDCVKLQVKQDE